MSREVWGQRCPPVLCCSMAEPSGPPWHLALLPGAGISALKHRKVKGERRGQRHSPGWGLGVHKRSSPHHKCCPAATGFLTVRATASSSLLLLF